MFAGDFRSPEGESGPWQNPANPYDVNGDGEVGVGLISLRDINEIGRELSQRAYSSADGKLPSTRPTGAPFFDVNNDGFVSQLDILAIQVFLDPPQPSGIDFGDAPTAAQSGFASSYPTVGGARHQITTLFLGSQVDADSNGSPDTEAGVDGVGGDDGNGVDDEDGVQLLAPLIVSSMVGSTSSVNIIASASGKVDAWIDFNRDGDWNDPGEQVLVSRAVNAGAINVIDFTVPTNAGIGFTAARVRLSSDGGLSPTGYASDGEVEDYVLELLAGAETPIAEVSAITESTEVLFENNRILVRRTDGSTTNLFSSGLNTLSRLDVIGNASDQNLALDYRTLRNLPVDVFSGDVVQLDGNGGTNTLFLKGLNKTLELSGLTGKVRNFSRFDISDDVPATLVVSSETVRSLSPLEKRIVIIGTSVSENSRDQLEFSDLELWTMGPSVVDSTPRRTVVSKSTTNRLTIELDMPFPWQNALTRHDVNNVDGITALDALAIITEIEVHAFSQPDGSLNVDAVAASPTTAGGTARFYDVNGDGKVTALDALQVINALSLSRSSTAGAEQFSEQISALWASGKVDLSSTESQFDLPLFELLWQDKLIRTAEKMSDESHQGASRVETEIDAPSPLETTFRESSLQEEEGGLDP